MADYFRRFLVHIHLPCFLFYGSPSFGPSGGTVQHNKFSAYCNDYQCFRFGIL